MAEALNQLEGDKKCLKLLVKTRLEMENEFVAGRKKKSELWDQVLNKVKEIYPDFGHSKEQITRIFLNLKTTYKRIKDSGRSATTWMFFDYFDEVYGTGHFIDPPEHNLVNSLDESLTESHSETFNDSQESEDDSPSPKRKKPDNNEILQYIKEEPHIEENGYYEIFEMNRNNHPIAEKYELEGEEEYVKLLVKIRLEMEDEFVAGRKKKRILWCKVLNKIKEILPDFSQSKEEIARKFLNLNTTYRRIKQRYRESGKIATTWTYFDDFDKVYGTRHSIDPLERNLANSLDENPAESQSGHFNNLHESESDSSSLNLILQYLKKESLIEKKRHEEILEIEKRKLAVEEMRTKALIELKEVIEKAFRRN